MEAAGESVPTPESLSRRPVVARKRPNGDRREARGESGRTVRRLKPSSRASGRGQCNVLETSTAAESVVRRRGTIIALYLEPDRFDLQFAKKELASPTRYHRDWTRLRMRRSARAILTRGSWKERRRQAA